MPIIDEDVGPLFIAPVGAFGSHNGNYKSCPYIFINHDDERNQLRPYKRIFSLMPMTPKQQHYHQAYNKQQ